MQETFKRHKPLVTIAVPSYNQGDYLDLALTSIFMQEIPVEVFVLDGGSSDNSLTIIRKWEHKLAGWRSCKDGGQAAAINEGIAHGKAAYVCWLNSDDEFLPQALEILVRKLKSLPNIPAVYARAWNFIQKKQQFKPVWVEPFDVHRLALRCIISQPATLIRRSAWEAVGGVDAKFHMAMDYDLWWRLYQAFGPLYLLDQFVAINRIHNLTKTNTKRRLHYQEAMHIVKKYYGSIPLKWWLAQPYAVWLKQWMSS